MCWSPTADIVAGTAVSAVGIATLASVRRPRDAVLASVPLVLGFHQLVEAFVWRGELGTTAPGTAELARNIWGFIAFPLLPFLVPLGVLIAMWPTAGRIRRPVLGGLLALGTVVAALLLDAMSGGVRAQIHGHTVQYAIGIPNPHPVIAGYLVATLGALLASGDRWLVRFGAVGAVGAAVCGWLWTREFASTWCALAAVVSVLLFAWVRDPRRGSADAGEPGTAAAGTPGADRETAGQRRNRG
jgi:hypothetical protein